MEPPTNNKDDLIIAAVMIIGVIVAGLALAAIL